MYWLANGLVAFQSNVTHRTNVLLIETAFYSSSIENNSGTIKNIQFFMWKLKFRDINS